MTVRADDSASPDEDSSPDAAQHCTAWLEHSVLPTAQRGVNDVSWRPDPADRGRPTEDAETTDFFVRPPSREIDFARVVRRDDLCRTAAHTAVVATGVTGLLLIGFLLTSSRVLLVLTVLASVTLMASMGVRLRLATAPLPYLEE